MAFVSTYTPAYASEMHDATPTGREGLAEDPGVTVIAVGDLMLGDSPASVGFGLHSRHPRRRVTEILDGLGRLLHDADVCIGNLEVCLTDTGLGNARIDRECMRGDPEYAHVLRDIGFDVLAVANNHALQHGDAGFVASVKTLSQAGIEVAGLRGVEGWCCRPVRKVSRSGRTVGILAYSQRPRQYGVGEPLYATGTEEQMQRDVERLARDTDHVVVSLHWGEEYVALPSRNEAALSGRLVDAGARVIVGHHPHVLRPVDFDGRNCIAYSLGNTASDMLMLSDFREGAVLRCTLFQDAAVAQVHRTWTDDDYTIRPANDWTTVEISDCPKLEQGAYEDAIAESMARYRKAVVRHIVTNAFRTPFDILSTQVARKVRNLAVRLART